MTFVVLSTKTAGSPAACEIDQTTSAVELDEYFRLYGTNITVELRTVLNWRPNEMPENTALHDA